MLCSFRIENSNRNRDEKYNTGVSRAPLSCVDYIPRRVRLPCEDGTFTQFTEAF